MTKHTMKRFAFYVQHPKIGYKWHIAPANNQSEAAQKVCDRIGGNVFAFGLISSKELTDGEVLNELVKGE